VRLFVYGTLLSGEANHGRLQAARRVGVRRTEPRYTLLNLGEYPALIEGGSTSVVGELYDLEDGLLPAIDSFEGHPSLYRRTAIRLLGGEAVEGYVLAVPRRRRRSAIIASGDWREHRRQASGAR
jgi:gamma-glutamylcyclotransferase (GGCT)/AIG2-like uncharacterized protein YtfP